MFVKGVGGPSISPIPKTYAQLVALVGSFVPGQKYRITDFQTTEYVVFGTYTGADFVTGPVEPLIVTAATESSLDETAVSETYPADVLRYNLNPGQYGPHNYGRIIFRHDLRKDIYGYYDWRVAEIRLWQDPDTLAYVHNANNGQPSQDFLTIVDPNSCEAIHIGQDVDCRVPKVCFQGSSFKVVVSEHQDLVVFVGNAQDTDMSSCVKIAFHQSVANFSQSRSSGGSDRTDFWGVVRSVEMIGGNEGGITFEGDLEDCVIAQMNNPYHIEVSFPGNHTGESLGNGGRWSIPDAAYMDDVLAANGLLIPGCRYVDVDAGVTYIAQSSGGYAPFVESLSSGSGVSIALTGTGNNHEISAHFVTDTDAAGLAYMVSNSLLYPGMKYRISDLGNAIFEAITTTQYAPVGFTWDDLPPSSVATVGGPSVPSNSAYNGNLRAYEFVGTGPTAKELHLGFQMRHAYVEGSSIVPHLHLYIPDDVAGGVIKFYCEYTWVNVGGSEAATTTISGTITRAGSAGVSGNAILSFGAVVGAGMDVSSIFSCRVYRDPADVADTFAASVWLKQADIHYMADSIGSDQEFSKS